MPEELVQEEQEQQTTGGETAEELAGQDGWVPQDEWAGDPSDWKTAEEFNAYPATSRKKLRERNDALYREFSDLKRQTAAERAESKQTMEGMIRAQGQIGRRMYEQAKADIIAKQKDAAAEGDAQAFERLEGDRAKLDEQYTTPPQQAQGQSQPPSEVVEWVQKNSWFQKDSILQTSAIAALEFERLTYPGKTTAEMLKAVEASVKKAHPAKFGISASPQVEEEIPTVFGGDGRNRGGASPTGKQAYVSLPADAKKAFKDFVKQGVMKDDKEGREMYAKDFHGHPSQYREGE